MPGLDVRTDGGYVVAPPSVVGGIPYALLRDRAPVSLTVVPDIFLLHHRNGSTPLGEPTCVTDSLESGAVEGSRNETATRLAGYFHSKSLPPDVVLNILIPFAAKCTPPLERRELEVIVNSVDHYPLPSPNDVSSLLNKREARNVFQVATERYESVTESVTDPERYENVTEGVTALIRNWVRGAKGKWWTTDELDYDLGIRTVEAKSARRVVLFRLRNEGMIESHARLNKMFRTKDPTLARMDFKNAPRNPGLDLRWPLQIETLVQMFPGNIAVIAGTQDSGKTAMMLSLIHLNQDRFDMYYFCSEMSDTDLRYRLEMFDRDIDDWKFQASYRVTDFADVIEPDAVNLIDFLELTDDAHMVNKYLTEIHNRLTTGIAVVGLQKKENLRKGDNYKYGKGAEGTAEKPRLYVTLDKTLQGGIAKIVKGKNWADRVRNPNGLQLEYRIAAGCDFIPMGEWSHEEL